MTQTKKESYSTFYNHKFPAFIQQDFQTDAKTLWQEIEQDLYDAAKPGAPDCDKLAALGPKLDVFLANYKPSENQREMMATILLRVLLEEKLANHLKINLMGLIYSLIGNSKDLKVNWKSIQAFLNDIYFKSSSNVSYARGLGFMDKLHMKLNRLIKKLKVTYPEESVSEVMTEMRQNLTPFFESAAKGTMTLLLFLRSSKTFSKNTYENLLPELFEMWSWKSSLLWDKTMLTIVTKIAR